MTTLSAIWRLLTAAIAVALLAAGAQAAGRALDVYFIDVEGGQSTLFVTPARQSLLVDTGYPDRNGRDPDRIMAAMKDARVSKIDYLLITHMHEDHNGGAAELARRVPIGAFIDYGSPVETGKDVIDAFAAYSAARETAERHGAPHIVPKPGDRLPIAGLDVRVLSADGETIGSPIDGAGEPNASCADYQPPRFASRENPRSLGIYMRYSAFTLLDLGDLVGPGIFRLVCPNDLIGRVDAFVLTHHANSDTNLPQMLTAIRPRVAIADNGAYKGGSPSTWDALREHPEIRGVWELHKSLNQRSVNFPDTFIANLEDGDHDRAAWIKLSAKADGSFSVTNGRTGWTRRYAAR